MLVAAFVPVLTAMMFVNLSGLFDRLGAFCRRLRPSLRRRRTRRTPVEQLAADLHRLSVHLSEIERSQELHRAARLRAAAIAYDAVLVDACRTLEIEAYDSTPLRPIERLETEAALAQEGLVW
jgi:hypothetical protein